MMKRFCYSLLLAGVFLSTQTASAQFSLGFVGVFNLPNLTIEADGFGSTKGSTGYGGGLVAQYDLSSDLAIVFRPTYLNNKGAELGTFSFDAENLPEEFDDVNFSSNIQISTIEFPLLVKYYFTDASARPYITAGPSFGLVSTAEVEVEVEQAGFGSSGGTLDIKEELSSMDMSFLLGLGVDVPLGSAAYFMDVMYGFGLSNLISDGDGSMKTKGIQISMGARFPLGGSN